MRAAALLRNVSVFSGLPDELLERLAAQVGEVHVRAGEWIMREGDAAQSLFVVCSGRLDVIDEGPPERQIRMLRRGDVLGELALLREGQRSASVRARRDVELLELGRTAFEALIEEAPSFALGLLRTMAAQLATSRTPSVTTNRPRTIAVVGADAAAPTLEVAEDLAEALAEHGSVATLKAGTLANIDQAERAANRVILCGAAPGDDWTKLCLGEADLLIVATSGARDVAPWEHSMSLTGCELLILGPAVDDVMIDSLRPREVQAIPDPSRRREALRATARRLTGRSVGIVLSGGGARALAHLGVLEELHAAGLRFDRVAGVSLGSLVAAATAAGFTPEETYGGFERSFVDTNPSNDFVPPAYSLIRGAKTRRMLYEAFGDRRIEELPLRFFCLSCDLVMREAVLHRTGPVVDAVYPSLAIPGLFPPVATPDGRLLVDGGVLDNLPVAAMARTGEGPVIAVDVTGRTHQDTGPRRPGMTRLARTMRRALTGSDAEIPRLSETIIRTLTAGSIDTVAAARLHADLVVTPRVDAIGLTDWKALAKARDLGRRAAREALAADADLPSRLGI